MIQSPFAGDRLSTLFTALAPRAEPCSPDIAAQTGPVLLVRGHDGAPTEVVLRLSPGSETAVIGAVRLDTRSPMSALLPGLSERLALRLDEHPDLLPLALLLTNESQARRCGWGPTLARLAEALLMLMLRGVIERYPQDGVPGLLAGLAHPRLCAALVAMHDDPGHAWTTDSLAQRAGLSRSAFMASFVRVVGISPGAYLSAWRMTLARDALATGVPLKTAARAAGFRSPEAFSRAYRRFHGHPPGMSRLAVSAGRAT